MVYKISNIIEIPYSAYIDLCIDQINDKYELRDLPEQSYLHAAMQSRIALRNLLITILETSI